MNPTPLAGHRWQRFALALAAMLVWAALSRAAALFEAQPGFAFFFPAAAVTVVAAARLGWLGVAAVVAANFILPWGAATDLLRQAAFAVPSGLWAAVVAVAATRTSGATRARLRGFVVLGVAGGALVAAIAGAGLLSWFQAPASWTSFYRLAFLWWISDLTPALVLGLPALVLVAPGVLVDGDDLTAWREWRARPDEVWRTVAFGVGGAALLLAASTLFGAEVHWFVVLLLPAIVAASVGGGVAAGLVVTGIMSAVYLGHVLGALAGSAGDVVVTLASTYANLCLFVAFAVIAGLLSGRNRLLVEHVRRQGELLTRGLEETVEALAAAMQARTGYGSDHLERVARLVVLVGRELGLGAADLATLRRAAILHDVGKIGVPESILSKAAELEVEERAILDRHVELGVDILQRVEFLHPVLAIVRYHQERWDGSRTGPRAGHYGLRGHEIPLGSRIIAAVEAFDAISNARPYRGALGRNAAIAELWRCSGSQFDPDVVASLTRIVGQERDLASAPPRLAARG
jgi:putative nucleotidyltransferase with HDIG domain